MQTIFLKEKILESSISPYDKYCTGYLGKGGYITALIMGIGLFKETFSHAGSDILDSIIAYDRTEVEDIYIGQINMTLVSSFCGPEGLIWGYDIAKNKLLKSSLFNKDIFKGIQIKSGEGLREAARILFGTREKKHFPFLPGSHVFCAGRYRFFRGPTVLYSAIAIGIPEDRNRDACLFMEDVGELIDTRGRMGENKNITKIIKERIVLDMVKSVLEIGKNQKIQYKEIITDFVVKEIRAGEIGCALVAIPYFKLARQAYEKELVKESLESWFYKKKKYFLDR